GIGDGLSRGLRVPGERHVARINVKFCPLGPRERPFALVALDKFLAGMTDLQQHLRLAVPARVLALKKMAEEFFLQCNSVVRVKMSPVFDAVHLEPFPVGCGSHETLKVAARMQALPAPIGSRE